MASPQTFVQAIAGRRSIYALGKDTQKFISNADLTKLIKETVKQSPSSFNSQSSRAVILLGKAHDEYWSKTVHDTVKAVASAENFEKGAQRIKGFEAAAGTVLFFEDETTVRRYQEQIAAYADRFPQWSTHSSGMAQINVWTVLEAAGLGANLQHYGNLTNESVNKQYGLPQEWKLHAELVFGETLKPAGEKTFIDDEERFKVFGDE